MNAPLKAMSVLVPYPVDKAYDYLVPSDLKLVEGDFVSVPLGNRDVTGVVWGDAEGGVQSHKLKTILQKYDLDAMSKVNRDFIDWVAGYTLAPKGSVLKMALSAPAGLHAPKLLTMYQAASGQYMGKRSEARQRILDLMQDGVNRTASEIAEIAQCSVSVVKSLAESGGLRVVETCLQAPCMFPQFDFCITQLSASQSSVADILCEDVRNKKFAPSLLDGVTGAGKTEVYFEAVAQALREGRQALILLPEIALSNAFLERFKKRFGCAPALWHSHLTPAQRREGWRGVVSGDTRVVVGARSALFLPFKDLGLIVVDEEHDQAYKQEDQVIYHARDMAVVRAHLGKIPIVLVSATPSLETMMNAWEQPYGTGRYKHLLLESRFGGAHMPDIEVVNLCEDKPERQCFLSQAMIKNLQTNLEAGEQSLLFLNRRGYAPLTICRTCAHRMECPRCTAWLVEHRKSGRLHCHHCGYHCPIPKSCPSCHDSDSFAACGPGVERIYEEVQTLFPDARVMILASDTAESHDEMKAMLDRISGGDVDIIIGTQIIAKGHHFPNLTFVGVVDADLGLNGGDLRASERTYQLLHQVAGRAGREQKKGRVLLQSRMPDHRIIRAMIGGRDEFLAIESAERESANMPPYSRLAGIIITGRDEGQVLVAARELGKSAPQGMNEKGLAVQTLGPAPAPFAKLRGKYRYRLLVRCDRNVNIQKLVATWVASVKVPSTVRVYVDIDPQSFL